MKRMLFVLSLFTLLCNSAFTQFVDPRLQSVFSAEYLQEISLNHPDELSYLNWYLDNSYQIIDIGPEKCENLPFLKYFDPLTKTIGDNVIEITQEDLNIFFYSFERKYDYHTTYRIGNSGKAIVFLSQKEIALSFNKHQNFN